MKIVKQSVELIKEQDPLKRIELAGRTAYKSESKITDGSAVKFVKMLINREHLSVLRHAVFYIEALCDIPAGKYFREVDSGNFTGNFQAFLECQEYGVADFIRNQFPALFEPVEIDKEIRYRYKLVGLDHETYTFRIVTNRAIGNEIVRHQTLSFTQESTRYIKYDNIEVIEPYGYDDWTNNIRHLWQTTINCANGVYKIMSNPNKGGLKAEIARGVLPLDLKTELVVTGHISAWEHFIKLRSAKDAHPQIREISDKISEILRRQKNEVTTGNEK